MYDRIYPFLCKHKLINTNQLGFRSKYSTEHALISLIETIKKYHEEVVIQRCYVKKVFFEISQNSQENTCARVSFLIKLQLKFFFDRLAETFTTVNHEILLGKLKYYGIRSKQDDSF